MSKLGTIRIKGVRGIRSELTLDLEGRSLLLRGDNGTGKSSIAQALRWCLLGQISSANAAAIPPEFQRHLLEKDAAASEIDIALHGGGRIVMKGGAIDTALTDATGHAYLACCKRSSPFLRRDELLAFLTDEAKDRFKHLERYGELGPNVLARLGKNAHRNGLIVEQYLKHRDKYGPTIVFAADTLHAQTLAGEFQKRGVARTDYVDYSRKNSEDIIAKYRRGELEVIVNVQMLTEGFDAPRTRTVFIARPTRSESLVVQMVGRALRGPRAGGNHRANLVTFLDTWSQYDVLGPEYALESDAMPPPAEVEARPDVPLVLIPPELIRDAYRLLQSNVKGQLIGVHACTPHGWYRWEEEFEDDVQSRTVMVFDTQREALLALLEAYPTAAEVPEVLSEEIVRSLIRHAFVDVPDPLPRWTDVKAIFEARRKGCELFYVTFEEKRAFDPRTVAQEILEAKLDPSAEAQRLADLWESHAACRVVYRQDEAAFREEVGRERTRLLNASIQRPKTDPIVSAIVPHGPPCSWPEGQPGRLLPELLGSVTSVKRHFPAGAPMLGDLRWMQRASKSALARG